MYTGKKQKLNEHLHKIHLECANYWNITWQYILTATNSQLDKTYIYIYINTKNSIKNWTHYKNINLTINIIKKQ